MKKILFIITAFMMLFALSVQVGAAESVYKDTLRVGVSYAEKSEVSFKSESGIDIKDLETGLYVASVPGDTTVTFQVAEGAMICEYSEEPLYNVTLESADVIYFNGSGYRGRFELKCANNTITVINIVSTEDYVASVLGKEMSVSWPLEALKAQAVCARNYALTIGGKHSSYDFDICTTQHCQVYGGIASEAERTRRAVEETKGILVTYKDKVVPLYYFSCDGGYTEDSENVWLSAEGYLRGKKDIYENPEFAKLYSWEKTMTKAEIEDILFGKGISIGELRDIVIDETSDNNGVIKLTFIGTEGNKSITKSSVRSYLSLNSNAFTIEKHAFEPENEEAEAVVMHVLSGSGAVEVSNPKYVMTSEGLSVLSCEKEESESVEESYASYTFNGHGWGHLVGMSQWGAYSMAVEGFNYRDILSFYYTDIEIVEFEFEDGDMAETEFTTDDEAQIEEGQADEGQWEAESENAVSDENIQWSDTGI